MTRAFKAWHNFNNGIWKYNLLAGNAFINRTVFFQLFVEMFSSEFLDNCTYMQTRLSKVSFLTAVLTYKVIFAFVVIGSFQFDNLTDQSSGKEAELKSYKDHCRLSLSRPPARRSKVNLGITHTESLFAGYINNNLDHKIGKNDFGVYYIMIFLSLPQKV